MGGVGMTHIKHQAAEHLSATIAELAETLAAFECVLRSPATADETGASLFESRSVQACALRHVLTALRREVADLAACAEWLIDLGGEGTVGDATH